MLKVREGQGSGQGRSLDNITRHGSGVGKEGKELRSCPTGEQSMCTDTCTHTHICAGKSQGGTRKGMGRYIVIVCFVSV